MKKAFFTVLLMSVHAFAGLTLTIGGDVNFNKSEKRSDSRGYVSGGKVTPFSKYTAGIRPLIDGDLNFANVETVISDRQDIVAEEKLYVFETHANAIQNMIDIGFNLMNLANNHAYDYGNAGIAETLAATKSLEQQNPGVQFFGLGYRNEVLQPTVFTKNGYTIAVASMAIIDKRFRATDAQPGLIHIHDKEEYYTLMRNMKSVKANYKILSIHYGTEGQVTLDSGQKSYYEYAIKNGDVDLVVGHHPHAARPVEKIGDKYIFFSLGNYLMLGSANITGLAGGLDFGLFSKLHLVENSEGRLIPEAIQLILLTNTHTATKPLNQEVAKSRLADFKVLGSQELGSLALPFEINSRGQGIFCLPNLQLESSMKACQN